MTFFGLKEGQDLETERHSPTKHSWEYPPPPGTQLINPFNKMGKVKILTKNADLFLYNPNKGSAQPVSAQTSVPEVPSSVPNVTSNRCFDIYSFRVALNRFISVYSLNGVLMKRG